MRISLLLISLLVVFSRIATTWRQPVRQNGWVSYRLRSGKKSSLTRQNQFRFFFLLTKMYSSTTLPRPPRVSKVNVTHSSLEIPQRANMSPTSAPVSSSDGLSRFDFTKTLSRSESRVMMRQGRQDSRSTQASIRRKNSVSLFFTGGAGSDDLRNSGDHWQELLVDPEIPGEILCRFPVVSLSRPQTMWLAGLIGFLWFVLTTFWCVFPVGR